VAFGLGTTYSHPRAPQLGHWGTPSTTRVSSSACSPPHFAQHHVSARSSNPEYSSRLVGSTSACCLASLRNTIISSGAKSSNRTGSPAMSETLTLRVLDSGIPGLKVCNLPNGVTWFFDTPKSVAWPRSGDCRRTGVKGGPRKQRSFNLLGQADAQTGVAISEMREPRQDGFPHGHSCFRNGSWPLRDEPVLSHTIGIRSTGARSIPELRGSPLRPRSCRPGPPGFAWGAAERTSQACARPRYRPPLGPVPWCRPIRAHPIG